MPWYERQGYKEKVAPRFELGMEALQASALPLGHATVLVRSNVISEIGQNGQDKNYLICKKIQI